MKLISRENCCCIQYSKAKFFELNLYTYIHVKSSRICNHGRDIGNVSKNQIHVGNQDENFLNLSYIQSGSG